MSGALSEETRALPIQPEVSPEELVDRIRELLNGQQLLAAKQAAARAVERFSDHPWLQKANRVLNPSRVTVIPARDRGIDRRKEYEWLRRHRREYRGRWVALVEDRLVACADSFDAVLSEVRLHDLETHPLVHHVE